MDTEINHASSQKEGPKRVLFIVTQAEMGGAQRFLYNFLGRLDKTKFDARVCVGSDGGIELKEKLRNIGIETITIRSLKRDTNFIKDISAVFDIAKIVKEIKPETIFLLSSKAGFIGSLAVKFLNNPKIKVIYRIGGWTFNDPWPELKKRIWIMLEKISAKWKDYIVVNNEHDLRQALKLGILPKKDILLIHNGLDIYKTEFMDRPEARKEILNIIEKKTGEKIDPKYIIGSIANFYPSKGLEYFIETSNYFGKGDNTIFVIIGDGEKRQELEYLIEKSGLRNKIFLIGAIKDAHRLLPAFDVFALTSVKEGFPWAILEALAAKIPVVATRVGAVPEVIDDGKNGFLAEPAKPEQIAGKIKEILGNLHLQKEFAIQGHQTVLFKFDAEKMVRTFEELL